MHIADHIPPALRKALVKLVAVMALLSIAGGFLLSHLVSRMNDISTQRSLQLLEVEEYLDDAVITLGQQVQEWKNMLLRSDNKELYARHLEAFKESSMGVQYALRNTRRTMQELGMDTAEVDYLINEHRSMQARYAQAFSKLDPQSVDSINEADRHIMGVDRDLRTHITTAKAAASKFAKQQLSGTSYAEQHRYMMFGILGAVCLFIMALVGAALGYRLVREHGAS